MSDFDTVVNKIKTRIGVHFDTDLARELEMKMSTYAANKKKKTLPFEEIIALCKARGWSIDDLLGDDPDGESSVIVLRENMRTCENARSVAFPLYEPRHIPSAGYDVESTADNFCVVPKELVGAEPTRDMFAIWMHDDSMHPNIEKGAILIIRPDAQSVEDGKPHLVRVGGEYYVRRLFKEMTDPDRMRIHADNPLFTSNTIERAGVDVIGPVFRVVTVRANIAPLKVAQ